MEYPVHRPNSLVKRTKLTPLICGATLGPADQLLRDEEIINKELSDLLASQSQRQERRRQISHQIWEENVYQPVSEEIRRSFDVQYPLHQKRRNNAYSDYIETLNRQTRYNAKNHVFLDIVNDDYNAFQVASIRATVRTDKDPNKVQRRKLQREFELICTDPIKREKRRENEARFRLFSFPHQSRDKHTYWHELMLAEIDSAKRTKSQRRMNSARLASQLDDPIEVEPETRRLFPRERAKSNIRPILYNPHDIQVQWSFSSWRQSTFLK